MGQHISIRGDNITQSRGFTQKRAFPGKKKRSPSRKGIGKNNEGGGGFSPNQQKVFPSLEKRKGFTRKEEKKGGRKIYIYREYRGRGGKRLGRETEQKPDLGDYFTGGRVVFLQENCLFSMYEEDVLIRERKDSPSPSSEGHLHFPQGKSVGHQLGGKRKGWRQPTVEVGSQKNSSVREKTTQAIFRTSW